MLNGDCAHESPSEYQVSIHESYCILLLLLLLLPSFQPKEEISTDEISAITDLIRLGDLFVKAEGTFSSGYKIVCVATSYFHWCLSLSLFPSAVLALVASMCHSHLPLLRPLFSFVLRETNET